MGERISKFFSSAYDFVVANPWIWVLAMSLLVVAFALMVRYFLPGTWGLVYKQMRQRSLGTTLTLLSVFSGTALAVGIFVLRRGGESLFVQREFGYDLIIGSSKGSPLQLVLNTVYNMDASPGNFPYLAYEAMTYEPPEPLPPEQMAKLTPDEKMEWRRGRDYDRKRFPYWRYIKLAVPFARGDTYRARPILATEPNMFGFHFDPASGALEPIPPTVNDVRTGAPRMNDRIFQFRPGERFTLASGRVFHPRKFEAVIGSEVSKGVGLKLDQTFQASHGDSKEDPHAAGEEHHHDEAWKVVGVLEPTGTAFDRTIFIPLTTFYCIPEHDKGIKAQSAAREGVRVEPGADEHDHEHEEKPYTVNADMTVTPKTPKAKWQLSGVFLQANKADPLASQRLLDHINNGGAGNETRIYADQADRAARQAAKTQPVAAPTDGEPAAAPVPGIDPDVLSADVTAVRPSEQMRMLFNIFMKPSSEVLLLISFLVSALAAVGILVSIYNSVAARTKEIAILRALGATKAKVLLLICLEAAFIGLVGAALGWAAGHLIGAAAAREMERRVGQGFDWTIIGKEEVVYVAAVVAIAALAGLVPALKAYRTPVATNLVAS